MFLFAQKPFKNMLRTIVNAYLICYNITKKYTEHSFIKPTKKESLMKAATNVSAGNLQLLDQAHYSPF